MNTPIQNAASQDRPIAVFNPFFYALEAPEENFYRFDIRRNGREFLDPEGIPSADDFALGQNIYGIELPGNFVVGDTVTTVMYGITEKAYTFLQDIFNVINNDGGLFSSAPGNPVTNVDNGALGYFMVSAVAINNVLLQEDGEAIFISESYYRDMRE